LKPSVTVIGTGYVGLPAALMLAKAGHKVLGVDLNENIVNAINCRVLLIKEEELKKVMSDPAVDQNLRGSTVVEPADVYIIAVPTPLHPRKKVADLSYVVNAVESIAPHLYAGALVVVESTIPPLTCRDLIGPMITKLTGLRVPDDVMVAHCPERILPGAIFHEIVHNDRLIGGMDCCSAERARQIYASFVQGELYLTDDVTAELCKLMENTYRDVNIALANEMAQVAETLGVDADKVFNLANKHPRVKYLRPGIGVGGHCIPIDPWFIKEVDPVNTKLIEVARRVNDERPAQVAARVRRALAKTSEARIVAIGASYKPDTEDCRESPAYEVVHLLRQDGYCVEHFDPMVEGMEYPSLKDVARDADLLLILVGHGAVLKELERDRNQIEAAMRQPLIWWF
jgi:UDP-N-acetyl-D-mannosaminuronic acid dehydrogenase